jgi:hypothetical protein
MIFSKLKIFIVTFISATGLLIIRYFYQNNNIKEEIIEKRAKKEEKTPIDREIVKENKLENSTKPILITENDLEEIKKKHNILHIIGK